MKKILSAFFLLLSLQSICLAADIAINVGTATPSAARLDKIKAMGVKYVRVDISWDAVQKTDANTFNWAIPDTTINAITSRGMKPHVILLRTPTWARTADCTTDNTCHPANPAQYAAFAAAAVARYPLVYSWEIWNEPNLDQFWKPLPNAADYAALLIAAYDAMKAVNPNVIVVTGGMGFAGTNDIKSTTFLQGIYDNGGGGHFTGVGQHPYCYSQAGCPGNISNSSAWSQMADTSPSLRSIMIAHGDSAKKIWATETGAPTSGGTTAVTEARQAQMVNDYYTKYSAYAWAGPFLVWHKDRDMCNTANNLECFFGLIRYDGANKLAYYSFILH